MEVITTTVFKAFDGKLFKTKEECEVYEASKKDIEDNIRYFKVYYQPNLIKTGCLQRVMFVAVYSNFFLHFDIITNYCIKKFGYLGPSVQGYGFQKHFMIENISRDTFYHKITNPYSKAIVAPRFLILSPKKFKEDFPKDSIYFDYMKEWGFK